jgi:hypothetical protein
MGTSTAQFDDWQRLEVRATQSGSNINYELEWTKVGGTGVLFAGSVAGTVGNVTRIDTRFGSVAGLRVGHLGVFSDGVASSTAYDNADTGFNGETARARMLRLADEESSTIALGVHDGDPTRDTEQLGPQRPTTLLDLLQEAADADGGILYEDPLRQGLVYRTRSSMENQLVRLTVDYGQLAAPFEPTESDLGLRNDVTVERQSGSSGRAVLEEGPLSVDEVGVYNESISLNLYDDDQPVRHAAWRLHLASWDEARYPTVRIMLHKHPALIPQVAALEIGDRIQIINTPSWMPPGPVDLIVQRIDDSMKTMIWDVTLTCSPAGPWMVGVVDDAVHGRVDTDGTELVSAVTSTGTLLPVRTTAGRTWTQDPADLPFDVLLGGEEATVTAITGGVADAFGRTVASGWGTADVGGAWTSTGGSASDYSVGSGVGNHTLTSVSVVRRSTIPSPAADFDLYVDVAVSVVAAGASILTGLVARAASGDNLYWARVEFTTAGGVAIAIRKRVSGTETTVVSGTTPYTYTAGAFFRLRFQGEASTLRARVWPIAAQEPPTWQVSGTDTSHTGADQVGCRSVLSSGNTNASPVVRYDNLLMANPQLMTVTRSANGIVKAHGSGTDVRLATPTIVAL